MSKLVSGTFPKLVLFFLACLIALPGVWAQEEQSDNSMDEETMLMFVGESLDVLSIASRREESAWQAPAVAHVITRDEMRERGVDTLAQALEMTPGFFMGQKEWGSLPYLRGIPNSALFLYDTVPLGTDTSKSIHQLDHELSMASVKRIEIVRGPGSVLWGPDAFAGIVNVVPMTGKDLDGVETGIQYEHPGEQKAFFVNWGHNAGQWDGLFSLSGRGGNEDDTLANIVSYWDDLETPTDPDLRFGSERPGDSRYFEFSGIFSFEDWLTISARVSESHRPYALTNSDNDLSWLESRRLPFTMLKVEAKKNFNHSSGVRFTGYISSLDPEFEIINRDFKQKERTAYAEMIYDKSFLAGRGLFTGGLSYRNKNIDNAPVWDGYLPELLLEQNDSFLPSLREEDYDTRLWSVFGQYSHKIGNFDAWLGLRYDAHDPYKDHLSFSTGTGWSPSEKWMVKLLYGTAYRTPFARQLIEENEPELEKIKSLSFQIAYKPSNRAELSVVGFSSKIENHIMEDPYAGLSQSNHQKIYGLELEGKYSPIDEMEFVSNLTLIDNSGPDETYHYNDFTFIRPDGTVVKHFVDLRYPFDTGPDSFFNFMVTWRPWEKFTTFLRFHYFSEQRLIFPRGEKVLELPGVWLMDFGTTFKDLFFSGLDLNIMVRNLADKEFETPGTYSTIEGDPFRLRVLLQKNW